MTPEEFGDACEGINRAVMVAIGATPANAILLGLSQLAAAVVFIAIFVGLLR